MLRYLGFRIGTGVIVVWLAYTLTFFGINILPSDPITIHLAEMSDGSSTVDPNLIAAMKKYYGYDQPTLDRYWHELVELVHGNFGYSLSQDDTVTQAIGQVLRPTGDLAGMALLVVAVLSSVLVITAALARNRPAGRLVRSVPALFSSIPTFWLGIVALEILSFQLGLMSVFPDGTLLSIVVPGVCLGIPLSAPISQVVIRAMDNIYNQPYIDVARAKGARPVYVFFHHVLRNAAPVGLTMFGLLLGNLIMGTVVTETVFSRPGIGQELEQAVSSEDVALIQGFVMLSAVAFVVINLLIDLAYPLLDPRVVVRGRRQSVRAVLAGAAAAPVSVSAEGGAGAVTGASTVAEERS